VTWQLLGRLHGRFRRWLLGEVLIVAAEAVGIVGLVVNGCMRDIAAMTRRGFPVFPVESWCSAPLWPVLQQTRGNIAFSSNQARNHGTSLQQVRRRHRGRRHHR
jgi:hypothetical protein